MVRLGASRDLIEAGLSEPADATTRYGISVAKPVRGERLGVMQCCHVGEDGAETPTLTEAIDAPVGIFGRAAGAMRLLFGLVGKMMTWWVIAAIDADTATLPRSMLGRPPVVMRYPAAVVTARCAIAAAWR